MTHPPRPAALRRPCGPSAALPSAVLASASTDARAPVLGGASQPSHLATESLAVLGVRAILG